MRERAASPVISVILMVAVTVILGSIASVFALDLGAGLSSPAPSANFEFEMQDNGDLQVTHTSGNTLNGDQLRFTGAALEKTSFGSITEWRGGTVNAGDSATVDVKGGETLRLIWQSRKSDGTATLAKYGVPSGVNPTASIGSVDAYYVSDYVTVNNIQFDRVQDNEVYVVIEDEEDEGHGDVTEKRYFSTDGGNLTVRVIGYYIADGETITVTVYESDSESNVLATATTTA